MKKINIDNLISEKIAQKNFEYDSKSWEKFQALQLAEKEKKKRKRLFWLIGALILTIFILASLLVKDSLHNTKDSSNIVQKDSQNLILNEAKSDSEEYLDQSKESAASFEDSGNDNLTIQTIADETFKDSEIPTVVKKEILKNESNLTTAKFGSTLKPAIARADYNQSVLSNSSSNFNTLNIKRDELNLFKKLPLSNPKLLSSEDLHQLTLALSQIPKRTNENKSSVMTKDLFANAQVGFGNEAHGISLLGLGINFNLGKKFTIGTGLNYQYTLAKNLPIHRATGTKYNFSASSFYESSIEADQLHHVQIPLMLYKHFNKNSIGIGINYSYLLLVKGTIESDKEGTSQRRSVWIVEDGLNRHQINANLRFGRFISKKVKLNIGFNYAITDLYTSLALANKRLHNGHVGVEYFFGKK